MKYIACYIAAPEGERFGRLFWVRDDGTPNVRSWATQFPSYEAAQAACNEIAENEPLARCWFAIEGA